MAGRRKALVSLPFGADELPVAAGDEVWDMRGGAWVVRQVRFGERSVRVVCEAEDGVVEDFDAGELTHECPDEPDPWGELVRDISEYCARRQFVGTQGDRATLRDFADRAREIAGGVA